tara:strand:- start:992 stop:1204 length:213 start_codon:yes stop_codon:yes gene_type:complete
VGVRAIRRELHEQSLLSLDGNGIKQTKQVNITLAGKPLRPVYLTNPPSFIREPRRTLPDSSRTLPVCTHK